jgi:hypothetical protein
VDELTAEFCALAPGAFDEGRDDGADEAACAEELLAEADTNNDGVVDFNEYINWWARVEGETRGDGGGGQRAGKWRNT